MQPFLDFLNMYEFLANTHNLIRWIVLPLMLVVVVLSWSGFFTNREYRKSDKTLGVSMLGLVHLQLLLGLILYFVSPMVQLALDDFGAAMKNAELRKIVMEHPLVAIIAVTLVQIGYSKAKKAKIAIRKHKTMAIYTTIALVLILSRIPSWSFLR